MAARNPPLWLQAGSHPATNDRLLLEALMAPPPAVVSGAGYGIVAPGDLAITQNGTPNMSVNVAAGKAFVDGTENANQGAYLCVNDATVNLAISASSPTNPRKDLVVAKVQDAEWSGATNSWSLAVVTGTPAASPAEPAIPANAIVLALVDVAANATTVTNANITDRRRRSSALGGIVVCTSATRPTAPYTGQVIYETDTDHPVVWDGAAWKQLGLKYDPPACRVYGVAQGFTSGAGANLVFASERYDTDNMHSTVTNTDRLTCNTAGVYRITACAAWAANGAGERALNLIGNNTVLIAAVNQAPVGGGPRTAQVITTEYKLAVGDFVTVQAYQSSGGILNVDALGNYSPEFSASWVARG